VFEETYAVSIIWILWYC